MVRLLLALCATTLLAGCFASAGNAYKGYSQNWGTYVANAGVDTFCLTPKLRGVISQIEGHFGRKVVVSSGYRDPEHNDRVGGADRSFHMKCMAADFFIPGVDKRRLLAYAVRIRGVGGLGCYPGRTFVHVDVRERPRGWNKPIIFNC